MPASTADLLDRYLHAVKFWLPKAQQEDIAAELAEDLHSQIEEREATLGRRLDDEEVAQILKERGAPMKVASGYLPQARLIDPAMVALYRLVLKIVLLWVLAPLFAMTFIGTLLASAHPVGALALFWGIAFRTGFMVVGMVTTAFVLLDRYHGKIKWFDDWDPRKLPRVPASSETSSRWKHLSGFLSGLFGAICWIYLMPQRTEFDLTEGFRIVLGPVWKYAYWPVLGLTLAGAAVDLIGFLRPSWTQFRWRARVAIDASILAVLAVLLKTGDWVTITAPNLPAGDLAKAMVWLNASIEISLIVVALFTAGNAIWEIHLVRRGRPAKAAPVGIV
jgi:hypothetical protein